MDLFKLDKMKVDDLRTELQTRGWDTKGVKLVLIERLKAHFEEPANSGGGESFLFSQDTKNTVGYHS